MEKNTVCSCLMLLISMCVGLSVWCFLTHDYIFGTINISVAVFNILHLVYILMEGN